MRLGSISVSQGGFMGDQKYFVYGFLFALAILVLLGISLYGYRDKIVMEVSKVSNEKYGRLAFILILTIYLYGLLSTIGGIFSASLISFENYGPFSWFLYGTAISGILGFLNGILYIVQIVSILIALIALIKYLKIKSEKQSSE
jgi:hypothetical protein